MKKKLWLNMFWILKLSTEKRKMMLKSISKKNIDETFQETKRLGHVSYLVSRLILCLDEGFKLSV